MAKKQTKTHRPTEGEWTQEYDGTVCMAGQAVIAVDWLAPDGRSFEERKANGRTICAAKPAIEALRILLDGGATVAEQEKAWDMARRAIEITEGE